MADNFNIPLKCLQCGATATARATEPQYPPCSGDGVKTTISHLPDGFKIVDQKSSMASVDIFCSACDVSAISFRRTAQK